MRIYLSGPMTGIPDLNRPVFHAVAEALRAHGHEVSNPAEVELGPDAQWIDYMLVDIPMLMDCDAICCLPGWHLSPGARIEVEIAAKHGLTLFRPSASFYEEFNIHPEAVMEALNGAEQDPVEAKKGQCIGGFEVS